jgi:hypothetical protein
MDVMNTVAPKVAAEHNLLFNEPVSGRESLPQTNTLAYLQGVSAKENFQ